jgi:hypothetical protein
MVPNVLLEKAQGHSPGWREQSDAAAASRVSISRGEISQVVRDPHAAMFSNVFLRTNHILTEFLGKIKNGETTWRGAKAEHNAERSFHPNKEPLLGYLA